MSTCVKTKKISECVTPQCVTCRPTLPPTQGLSDVWPADLLTAVVGSDTRHLFCPSNTHMSVGIGIELTLGYLTTDLEIVITMQMDIKQYYNDCGRNPQTCHKHEAII